MAEQCGVQVAVEGVCIDGVQGGDHARDRAVALGDLGL
jgi:hypothetical protein